jgi:uncharacterized protein
MKPKKTSPGKKPDTSPRSGRTVSSKRKTSAKTPARNPQQTETALPSAGVPTQASGTVVRKSPAGKIHLTIPPILLEGDQPSGVAISGPGQRYALGPVPPIAQPETEVELPDSYGTAQLLLAARDPHWLYTHWDLSRKQQLKYNALSRDRHLVLRVYTDAVSTRPSEEVHVHSESRHWFIHVERADTRYVAQLGYYPESGGWVTISTSGPTLTPPDTASADTTAEFATIPFELPMAKLLEIVKETVHENVPLAQALEEIRGESHPELPSLQSTPQTGYPWTPAQERALAEIVSMDRVRRVWMGSMEITELIRRQVVQEMASMAAAQLGAAEGAPTSPRMDLGGISSPAGRRPSEKGFWFNVNAELIIYGATEPNAKVTLGGREVRLRPDGSFSYRFALPDGQYELAIVAVSADGTDGRAAEMNFSRSTEYRGDVGMHPQDPELKRPQPASI